ncbi:hypothetical protein E4U59_002739 [Claviceps monticola]|nr:hypothetical protein E4U59_002739 [Claviceps monticola]
MSKDAGKACDLFDRKCKLQPRVSLRGLSPESMLLPMDYPWISDEKNWTRHNPRTTLKKLNVFEDTKKTAITTFDASTPTTLDYIGRSKSSAAYASNPTYDKTSDMSSFFPLRVAEEMKITGSPESSFHREGAS